jgi:hypothetical protein
MLRTYRAAQNRIGRSGWGFSWLRMRPANDCQRFAETAGAKRKAIMVEMAKLWGECAEDAEQAERIERPAATLGSRHGVIGNFIGN